MKTLASICSTLLVLSISSANAQDITVSTAPPVVVKTFPQAGVEDVDPSLKEIKVTFSKAMTDKSWSWANAFEGSVPKSSGMPKYDEDKRTCVMPVTLQPNTTYAIWVNTNKFRNFKDADGRPSVPYLFVFKTKG